MKIIHRDLKFQNIMLAKPPDECASPSLFTRAKKFDLKIVDFGIFGSISGS